MTTDTLIPLSDVPKLKWLPRRRRGAHLAYATLWRWAARGVSGVRLQTVKIGSQPCTTEAWLREFFDAIAVAQRGGQPTSMLRTPARRQRDIAQAQRELVEAGVQ